MMEHLREWSEENPDEKVIHTIPSNIYGNQLAFRSL